MKRILGVILVVVALLGAVGLTQGAMTGACGGSGGATGDPKPCGS